MRTRPPGPTLHLVDDEEVVLRVNGYYESFRVRIWRAKDEPALVLVSQVPGNVPPSKATERLANAVKAAWLAHDPRGMFWFELASDQINAVTFINFGRGDRSRLTKPKYQKVGRNFIDEIVGQVVAA